MKEGVFIANTARGGVLNEVALIDAIERGKVAGAALDVLEFEKFLMKRIKISKQL